MRYGFTTGSCAAAAAKGAAWMLLTGRRKEEISIETPKGIRFQARLLDIRREEGRVRCAVRKDGGDDPDVTTGTLIYAEVSILGEALAETGRLLIDGGEGVGRVTRPGLDQPVGNAAINSTPREMIRKETEEVCRRQGYRGGLKVMISIPGGEKIAAGTFNPRLGIRGGLSVLGTSGIVMPMSEEALVKSIEAEMRMLAAAGGEYLVVTPGNYGEAFAGQLPDLDLSCEMKCSNYVGETLDLAEELGIRGILFIAHIGKFIKVSGGIMNTHSRNADARAELMAAAAFRAGADRETVRKILDTGTTEEALDVLAASGQELLEHTMEEVCGRVQFYLNQRTKGSLETGAILFSSVRGKLGETETVPELIRRINEQKARIKI